MVGRAQNVKEAPLPTIIDVEASGFGPHSYPIEVGLALPDGKKYCTLILPLDEWTHWDEEAEKVHRIPRDILEYHGREAADVAKALNEMLAGETVYTDGWVVDKPWLIRLFHETGIELKFEISSLEMILTEDQMNRWHDTKDTVLADLGEKRHRASFDAFVVQQTWIKTRDAA